MIRSILCIVAEGPDGMDAQRAALLAGRLQADTGAELVTYHANRKLGRKGVAAEVTQALNQRDFDIVYMEGTGIGTGWPLIGAGKKGLRYIVSSGDPISGFFHTTKGPVHGTAFGIYEKLLMKHCAGFVGWTPYLTGRAIDLGAPRGVTVEGGAKLDIFTAPSPAQRLAARQKLGIPADHLVCCVVGSIRWSDRQSYTYGYELVQTLKYLKRTDVTMLIVGDGTGRPRLEEAVPAALKTRAVFTGRLPRPEVVEALHAADIGFVTQTLDRLGSFRLTTKLPEYMAAGLGVAMSPIPGFFDYVEPGGWVLPPQHPGAEKFHRDCAAWLDTLSAAELEHKRTKAQEIVRQRFDYDALAERFSVFVRHLDSA